MIKRITLRHLEAFRAVMMGGTVTQAAGMLFVSQPVVTRLIADMEARLGFPLFERARGRLHPTPEAAALFEEVQRSLIGLDRIVRTAEEIRTMQRGSLQIAAAPALALTFLPRAMAGFIETHPQARMTLLMHSSHTVVDMVMGNRCDIGFAILPIRNKSAHGELLLSAKMVCALPVGHPLADRSVIRPEDLRDESFISPPDVLISRMEVDSIFAAHGVTRRLNLSSQTSYSMLTLVEAGAGVSLMDPLTAACYAGDRVRFVPFEPDISIDFSILTARNQPPSVLVNPFIAYVRERLREAIPPNLVIHA